MSEAFTLDDLGHPKDCGTANCGNHDCERDRRLRATVRERDSLKARVAELERLLRFPSAREDAAVLAEREACAKLVEEYNHVDEAPRIAADLRARGGQ